MQLTRYYYCVVAILWCRARKCYGSQILVIGRGFEMRNSYIQCRLGNYTIACKGLVVETHLSPGPVL